METVIVTGAGGLLGRHVLPLLADAREVWALGRPGGVPESANVRALHVDLSEPLDVSGLPPAADAVIHLAQSSRFRDFPESAADMFQINTARLIELLDYARKAGVSRFIYASTGGVYGSSDRALREDDPAPATDGAPLAFYPATKRAGELLAQAYSPHMSIAVLRYFFIYGRGQKRDMLVPRLVDSVREARPVTLQGEEGLRINPIHASDAARATVAAARLGRSITANVAGSETLSIRGMCETIGALLGREPLFDVQRDQKAPSLIADVAALSSLGGPPTCRFEDGVRDLL